MTRNALVAIALTLAGSSAAGQTRGTGDTGGPYDGDWMVVVACDDTQDRHGLVKGYEQTFRVTISNGRLHGQYGERGAPASVVFAGDVGADGALEVLATGNSGRAEHTVGQLVRGTPFGYTMEGKLDQTHGQAVRREVRPCKATFNRL